MGDLNFSENQQAGSSVSSCPLKDKKEDPCDPDGLKIFFNYANESSSVECKLPRQRRDIKSYLSTLPVEDNDKYNLVNDYDCILEVIAEPTSSSAKDPGIVNAEPILGEGPCDSHLGIDFTPKNIDSHDQLKAPETDVRHSGGYQMWAKHSLVDTNLSHTMGFVGCFLMFDDTKEKEFIKEVEVTVKGCAVRHDGKQPNEAYLGLLRIYRNDEYALKFSMPSRYKKSKGGDTYKALDGGVSSESRSSASWRSQSSKSYKDGALDKEKTTTAGVFSKRETVKEEGEKDKIARSANEKGLTLSRSGHELDFTKKFNDIVKFIDTVYDTIDFAKELKDSIPKAGISGDISIEFISGSVEAKWGYGNSDWDEDEYKWLVPKFTGTVSLTIFKASGEVKAGIETVSPSILNWWGKKAWEFELSLTIGFSADLSISTSIEYPSKENFPQQAVLSGCEYEGKNGQEQKVANIQSEVKPIFKGVAKVNVLGIGAEASIELEGSIKVDATVCWPFDVRYKGALEQGRLIVRYTVGAKEPSPPHEIKCWDKNDKLIEENYLFGGKKA
jgi:hypothetical protein